MLPETEPLLLVDDSADDRFLLRHAFNQAGVRHPLVELEDGQEVVDYLTAGKAPPGLILLDIKMPRMTGLETLEWLRASEKWRCLPVVVLSASVFPGDIKKSYMLGANAFHVKPTTAAELAELMAALKAYWLRFAEFPQIDR